MPRHQLLHLTTLVVGALGCRDTVAPRGAPTVTNVTSSPSATSVLAAAVRFSTANADSARVLWDDADGDHGATPFVETRAGGARVFVLGLRASRAYTVTVEAHGARVVLSAPQSLTTGELPTEIRSLRLSADHAGSRGLTLVAPLLPDTSIGAIGYLVAFDSLGEIRWYHAFPGMWAIEAKQQRNGHITVYTGRSYGWQPAPGQYLELDAAGETIRSFSLGTDYYTDPHELLLTFTDTSVAASHLIGYEFRSFDLSAFGGGTTTSLAVHVIERRSPSGTVEFHWSAGDLFQPSDWPFVTQLLDLDHPSSLAIDVDGNYVVSFQAMGEVTKINATTGQVMWRLGGRHNEFTFQDDPLSSFSGQHDVQVLPNGHILLLDDQLHVIPGPARAVEYALDPAGRVASLVWQYRPQPSVISPIMGSVQRLTSGATLVGFGAAGRVVEVSGDGTVSWSSALVMNDTRPVAFYRAIRLASLYKYEAP
jgi:outer membrane protein assembly factor BamB